MKTGAFRVIDRSVVLEDLFQRGGVKDVFRPLLQLFDRGGFEARLSLGVSVSRASSRIGCGASLG